MREETYDVIVTAGGFSSNAINPNHITELLRYSVQCSTQKGLNTTRVPRSSSFFIPRNLSNHMDGRACTGDTVLVRSREMTGRGQTLPRWLGRGGVKTTENKINWLRWFKTWRKERMKRQIEPNNRQSRDDVLLWTYESNTEGFTSFLREETSFFDWAMNGGDTIIPLSLRLSRIEFSLV